MFVCAAAATSGADPSSFHRHYFLSPNKGAAAENNKQVHHAGARSLEAVDWTADGVFWGSELLYLSTWGRLRAQHLLLFLVLAEKLPADTVLLYRQHMMTDCFSEQLAINSLDRPADCHKAAL